MDTKRAWCPRAGCETICSINSNGSSSTPPGPVHCPNCSTDFCSLCREAWHSGPCPDLPLGIPFDSDHIKCCPMCSVRASVIWHRTQVIGIFAGFGLLLLVASPLLLLAAPCIVCCKCRVCGSSRLEQEDGDTAT